MARWFWAISFRPLRPRLGDAQSVITDDQLDALPVSWSLINKQAMEIKPYDVNQPDYFVSIIEE